ncbi:protein FAM90A1-like [Meriones unguiculatus]|uniref:protein FAM90A1-like n=1 Tax=Meriones unguiculatus TaxID=10047 RepID=UPI00293F5655|nr:protein FAM90A1-like [Meriones unguiculatus]
MKCKDCGAFGHTIRSRKCPMKCWDGAKAPQPFGVKMGKENRDPRKPQNPQSPKLVIETEEERRERERQEQQRKALLLKFPKKPSERKQSWKDTTHSGDYLRRPSRPSFIHINRKVSLNRPQNSLPLRETSDGQLVSHIAPSTEDPNIIFPLEENESQTLDGHKMSKTAFGHSDENPAFSENPADQSTEHCFRQIPQAVFSVQEMGHMVNTQSPGQHFDGNKHWHLYSVVHTATRDAELIFKVTNGRNFQVCNQNTQNSLKKCQLSPYQTPQKSTKTSTFGAFHAVPCSNTSGVEPKELPQGNSIEQLPQNTALLNVTQPHTETHISHVPVQHLRMLFTRLANDCWSSKIL